MSVQHTPARRAFFNKGLAMLLLASGIALVTIGQSAHAEELSTQQILDGLRTPGPGVRLTRGLSLGAPLPPRLDAQDLALINRVRGQTRSLSLNEREQMATIVTKRPKVDLEITFEYNSATLSPIAIPQLNNLGRALTSADLAGAVMMLSGHTDAKGGEDYNQQLSERRAEAVKRFLVENYRIPAANLVSAGYGKKGLKNERDPFAPENRRVEVVNMAEREQASR